MFSKHEYSMKRPGNNAHLIEGEPHSGSTNKGTNSAAVYVSSPWTGEASVAPPSFVAAILLRMRRLGSLVPNPKSEPQRR